LPDSAKRFVDSLRSALKATTCYGYLGDLRDLHAWLDAQGFVLETLDRDATERWLKSLADRGLAPTTRNARILHARSYLWWLAERGDLAAHPGDLLRATDLPKLPSYLPRPFPVEADHELQRRFRQAGTLSAQALFLMRRSGVRIGELARLEPRCLDEDPRGHVFLKVPLGKLDNERLVPLDDETRQLAELLQARCPTDAPFLLEPHLARSTVIGHLGDVLKDSAQGLDIPGPVVSHRLRHTYATELLNAGVSIIAVMKLLGHRSLRMTMRYAAITQQTVTEEFYAASARTAARYDLPASPSATTEGVPDIDRALLDVIYALRSLAGDDPSRRPLADRLNSRLYKLRHDIALAFAHSEEP
jgi:site-specific recombinase XerD